jgi:hypothetical protein
VPRFKIPVDQLPPTDSEGKHLIRFRITTEDKNNVSEWSQIFNIESVGQIPSASVSYQYVLDDSTSPKNITLIWEGGYLDYHTELDQSQHDVFVKWDSDPYLYLGRTIGNSFRLLANPSKYYAKFIVQVPSYPEGNLSEKLKIFETESIMVEEPPPTPPFFPPYFYS